MHNAKSGYALPAYALQASVLYYPFPSNELGFSLWLVTYSKTEHFCIIYISLERKLSPLQTYIYF